MANVRVTYDAADSMVVEGEPKDVADFIAQLKGQTEVTVDHFALLKMPHKGTNGTPVMAEKFAARLGPKRVPRKLPDAPGKTRPTDKMRAKARKALGLFHAYARDTQNEECTHYRDVKIDDKAFMTNIKAAMAIGWVIASERKGQYLLTKAGMDESIRLCPAEKHKESAATGSPKSKQE